MKKYILYIFFMYLIVHLSAETKVVSTGLWSVGAARIKYSIMFDSDFESQYKVAFKYLNSAKILCTNEYPFYFGNFGALQTKDADGQLMLFGTSGSAMNICVFSYFDEKVSLIFSKGFTKMPDITFKNGSAFLTFCDSENPLNKEIFSINRKNVSRVMTKDKNGSAGK